MQGMMPTAKPALTKWCTQLEFPMGRDDMIKSIWDGVLNASVDSVSKMVATIDQDSNEWVVI